MADGGDLRDFTTPRHEAQLVGFFLGSHPVRLTVLAAKSEDYTSTPQLLLNNIVVWLIGIKVAV